MKTIYYCLSLFLLLLVVGVVIISHENVLTRPLYRYACHSLEQRLGSLSLAPDNEKTVRGIASEMGIDEPIVIRKMNCQMLAIEGYYNARFTVPTLFRIIPLNKPYIYLSEGFFEDLSSEEQRFIIGHELIHIRDRHGIYVPLVSLVSILLLLMVAWGWGRQRVIPLICQYTGLKSYPYAGNVCMFLLTYLCLTLPNIAALAYKRSIEQVADCKSTHILKSYDGGIKLIERWQREFGMVAHEPYGGLFADHPSCSKRKQYLAEWKCKSEG